MFPLSVLSLTAGHFTLKDLVMWVNVSTISSVTDCRTFHIERPGDVSECFHYQFCHWLQDISHCRTFHFAYMSMCQFVKGIKRDGKQYNTSCVGCNFKSSMLPFLFFLICKTAHRQPYGTVFSICYLIWSHLHWVFLNLIVISAVLHCLWFYLLICYYCQCFQTLNCQCSRFVFALHFSGSVYAENIFHWKHSKIVYMWSEPAFVQSISRFSFCLPFSMTTEQNTYHSSCASVPYDSGKRNAKAGLVSPIFPIQSTHTVDKWRMSNLCLWLSLHMMFIIS